jgi:hypothetical protein
MMLEAEKKPVGLRVSSLGSPPTSAEAARLMISLPCLPTCLSKTGNHSLQVFCFLFGRCRAL